MNVLFFENSILLDWLENFIFKNVRFYFNFVFNFHQKMWIIKNAWCEFSLRFFLHMLEKDIFLTDQNKIILKYRNVLELLWKFLI